MRLFFILLLLPAGVLAQGLKSDFPEISKEDLLQTVYSNDSTADAVVLYDQGETIVDGANGTRTKHYTRIKILNRSGFKYGDVTVYTFLGDIAQIKAVTHVYDKMFGKIVTTPLGREAIFKTRMNKWINKITFTMPNLAEGAIIEYSYTDRMNFGFVEGWTFQRSIPVQFSEFIFYSTSNWRPHLHGSLPPPRYDPKYKTNLQRWVMRDVPPLKIEPLMPNERIYRSALSFLSPNASWSRIIDYYYSDPDLWGVVRNYPQLKEISEHITRGLKTDEEKINAICSFVKREVEWNGNYSEFGDDPTVTLKKKKGNSGDINLLAAGLLEKAGIKIALVLTSTRGHGLINPEFISAQQFNNVVCMVESPDSLLLDCTNKFASHKVLPKECLNYTGLMLSATQSGLIKINSKVRDKKIAQLTATLSATGELTGSLDLTYDGYAAIDARSTLSELGKDGYVKRFGEQSKLEVSDSQIKADSINMPVTEKHAVITSEGIEVNADKIYFNPFLLFRQNVNPFADPTRTYPVDFGYGEETVFVGTITLPPGYEVEEMPAGKMFNLPGNGVRYIVDLQRRQDRIIVTTKLIRSKVFFQPNEYHDLKEFYARVVAKNQELVVVKKVN